MIWIGSVSCVSYLSCCCFGFFPLTVYSVLPTAFCNANTSQEWFFFGEFNLNSQLHANCMFLLLLCFFIIAGLIFSQWRTVRIVYWCDLSSLKWYRSNDYVEFSENNKTKYPLFLLYDNWLSFLCALFAIKGKILPYSLYIEQYINRWLDNVLMLLRIWRSWNHTFLWTSRDRLVQYAKNTFYGTPAPQLWHHIYVKSNITLTEIILAIK